MPSSRRPRLRRALRLLGLSLLWPVLLLVILVSATLQIATLPAGRERVRQLVLSQVRPILPGLQLGYWEGDLTSELILGDVSLADRFGQPVLRVERITLRYDLLALLRREVRVELVELRQPELDVRPTDSGELNLAELLAPRPPSPEEPPAEPSDWTVRLESLRLIRGELSYAADPQGPLRVNALQLAAKASAGPDKLSLTLSQLAGRVTLPDGRTLQLDSSSRVGLRDQTLATGLQLEVLGLGQGQGQASLTLEAQGPLDDLQLTLSLGLPAEGLLRLSGRLGLLAELPRYSLELQVQRLDPGAILPELPRGELNTKITVSGRGIPLTAGSEAEIALAVQPSQALGYRLDDLQARATLKEDRWRLHELRASAGSLQLRAQGRGTLEQLEARATIATPELASLPLPAGTPPLSGAAEIDVTVKGPLAGPLRATLALQAQQLALPPLQIQRLALRGSARDLTGQPRGQLRLDLQDLQPGPGQPRIAQLTLAARGNQQAATLELEAAGPELAARLAATLALDPERIEVQLQQLSLALRGQKLRLLSGGRLRYWLDQRLELQPTRLALLGGEVKAAARVTAAGTLRGELELSFTGLRPLPQLPVSGQISAKLAPRELQATITSALDGGRGRLALEARLPLRSKRGSQTPQLALGAPLSGALRLEGLDLTLLEQLQGPALAGALDASLLLSGSALAPAAELQLSGRKIRYGQLPQAQAALTLQLAANNVAGSVRLQLADQQVLALDLRSPADLVKLARAPQRWRASLAQTPFELQGKLGPLDLQTVHSLHPQLAQLAGSAALELQASGKLARPQLALDLTLDQAAVAEQALGDLEASLRWQLPDQALHLSLERNREQLLTARGKLGLTEAQLLSGKLPAALPLHFDMELQPLALAELKALLPQGPRLDGRLAGRAQLDGTLVAPTGSASLTLSELAIEGVSLGSLQTKANYDGRRLTAALQLQQAGEPALTAEAQLELSGKQALQARVEAPALSLAPLEQLVPLVQRSDGRLQLDLRATGTLRQPLFSGKLGLTAKELRLTGTPAFEDVALQLELYPQRLKLAELRASSGGGTLTASGRVDLAGLLPRDFYLRAQADRFKLGYGPIQETRYSGPLRVKGSLHQGKLTADLLVDEGSIRVPKMADQPTLHPADLPEIIYVDAAAPAQGPAEEQQGASGPASAPLALNVRARTTPLFVRSEELDLEVETDVEARSDDQGRVRLYGTIQIRRGWIELLGYRYEVRQAAVSLAGQPQPDPTLDILLSRQIADVTLFIALRGTASAPELVLRSEPPVYETSQLLSMVLTGRPELSSGQESDQKMALASAVSQALFGGLVRKLVPKTVIDTARVSVEERNEQGESTLRIKAELGRYLTERLYLGFRRVFTGAQTDENVNEGLLEYRISARWLLQALFGDAGVGGLDLLWTYRY